jgi:quinol monooxygenase YgiN
MITQLAILTAAEGKADDLRAALQAMVAAVDANEPGVAAYTLHTSESDPNAFYLYEQYDDEESLQAHGQTEHMAAFGASLRDLLGGRPEIIKLAVVGGVNR